MIWRYIRPMTIPTPSDSLNIESAWRGETLRTQPDRWIHQLSENEIQELDMGLSNIQHSDPPQHQINSDSFPLAQFGEFLEQLKSELTHGIGFKLIRGLPIDHYSEKQSALIFLGIGAWLGGFCSQNANGDLLGHVRDIGESSKNPNARIYQTTERQTFHTDSADVVGLLCLKTAMQGGESQLVSAATIYNEFRHRNPQLLKLLFENIATDRRGEIPQGMQPWFSIPVFSWFKNYLTVMYQRQYIESAQRFSGAPKLTPDKIQALDLFDQIANQPDINLEMSLEPGDMLFIHNHSLLHDRKGFTDWPNAENKRHLLRLWLSLDNDRPLPPVFAQRFGTLEIGKRGGIITPESGS